MIPSAVFIPVVALQTKFSLSSKFLWNLGSVAKTPTLALPTSSRKHATGFLVKCFCVPKAFHALGSSHCIPAQKFVSVSGELDHDRSPLVLDSDKDVCCHHSFSYVHWINSHRQVETYLNRDMCKFESSQKDESRWQSTDSSKAYRNTSACEVDEGYTVRSCKINRLIFSDDLVLLNGVRRKFSWGFHSVAYGRHLYLVCVICDVTIWHHIHVSEPTFWQSLLTQYAYSSTRTLLILYVIALNINYQRFKQRYRRKIHSALRRSSS